MMWSIAAARVKPLAFVECTSAAYTSCEAANSARSGDLSAAATRGSSSPSGNGSLATSSDCTTTGILRSSGSTS